MTRMHYRSRLAFVMSGSSRDLKKGFVSRWEGGPALNARFDAQGMQLAEGNLYVSVSDNYASLLFPQFYFLTASRTSQRGMSITRVCS